MKLKINTHKICAIAMLIAISFVLGTLTIRPDDMNKISFKFLPIFLCSAFYGPIYGGLCGGLSDILSYILNPGNGPLFLPITFIEFLYGFSFGIFFHKSTCLNSKNILKLCVCIALNTIILSLGVMSFILMNLYGQPYTFILVRRIFFSGIVNAIIQFVCISSLLRYMPALKRLQNKSAF